MDKNYFDKQRKNDGEKGLLFIHSTIDEYEFRPNQFRVLCHVARRAGAFSECRGSKQACRAGVRSMAKHCRIAVHTVRKTLAELVFLRVLKRIVRGPGLVDLYAVNPRCEWEPPQKVVLTRFGPNWNDSYAE